MIYFASLLSHFIIDGFKSLFWIKARNKLLLFFVDQVLHGIVILALVNHYTPFEKSFWQTFQMIYKPVILLFLLFSILVTVVSGIIIKQILTYLNLKAQCSSNKNTGTYIGILERLLIFICIVSGFYEGIGYLLAAKSIFRFGDLTKVGHRSMTEYVLIGTLLSFTSAILWSLLYLYLHKNLTNLDVLINQSK